MVTAIRLVQMPNETSYAPLGVVGYCLTRTDFLRPLWASLALGLKTVEHSPQAKLLDVLVSILAGCRAVMEVNSRLRPDNALARAWGRARFAEQSSLARTLDEFGPEQVEQLRSGSEALFRRESRALQHDFEQGWLWLDIDLSPLPVSKRAESSTKGKHRQRNRYGRQLARVHAPAYHETLFSRLYPGNQESSPAYVPTIATLDTFLKLTAVQKQRTVLRSDAGFGSDANINYALNADWQLLTKSRGGRRPHALAQQVAPTDWITLRHDRWVAEAVTPRLYARPTRCLVLRWLTPGGEVKHAVLVTSLTRLTMTDVVACYDDRGACETEIQADKGGLRLERRRKKRLAAQEALVLLTDLAHNLLAWLPRWMFPDQPPVVFGTTRWLQDILQLPGRLFFDHDQLVEVQLNRDHPHAAWVALGLEHLLTYFGHP